MDEQVGLGLGQQLGDRREAGGQAAGHPAELHRGGVLVGLLTEQLAVTGSRSIETEVVERSRRMVDSSGTTAAATLRFGRE